MHLHYNNLIELPDGIFDELASLQGLTLYMNDISTLPDGVFDELAMLRELYLSGNDISTLPDGVFGELAMLRELYLSGNDISTLPDGIFDELANLEGLYLDWNALTELPDGIFHNLANLSTLSLSNNQLITLPAPLFSGMDWRNNRCFAGFCLYIAGNQIAELPDGLFHIEDFDAVRIHMQDNPGAPFTFSMEAEVIDQTTDGDGLATARVRWKVAQGAPLTMRANLSVTGGTASDSSVTIRSGSIYSNEITVAQSEVGQTATLTLGEVSAHRLRGGGVLIATHYEDPSDWTRFYYDFEFAAGAPLTLFDSPTPTPIPGICGRTQQVQDAILAKLNEGLDTAEVTDCAAVTAEDLSGITGQLDLSIEEIPVLKSGDFQGLSNLNILLMTDSGLETLPEDIFDGLTALHSLYIIGNDDLGALPEDIFDGLTSLTTLTVSGNAALGELPEGIFGGLTSLVSLSLAENSLSELPEDIFDGLTSLRLLHLQNNHLTGLPSGVFNGLANLAYIRLNGNSLRSLPADVFEGLSSLTQLPLEGNDLESLPDGLFEGLVSLEQVLLSSNEGAPFTLTAELEQRGDGAFVVKVAEGSPFDLTVTLSARGGTLSSTTVTVAGGSLASGPVSVEASGNGPGRVTVTVESATFPEDREYIGVNTGLGQPLVLDVPGDPPAEEVRVTVPATVPQNVEAAVMMSFGSLESDSDTSDTDYIFRADVKDAENRDADACEGGGMGHDRYMYKVDEDPEVRAATISAACPPGDYTIEVSISSPGNVELASATADFTVAAPAQQQQAQEPPLSTDATLSGLTLSDVTLAFASTTTKYTASVANDVDETTVTPTLSDDGAAYAIKLGGVADADGVIPLAVGSNVITIEVTAEDGNTAKTYTVTVTRATPTVSGPAVSIELSPSGSVAEGTEITVTMSFANLESDTDTSDTDYIFRADVVNADACEGGGMGNDRYMYKVDEDPEVRTGSISTSCAPGDYTVEVSISSPGNVELASATASFTVNAPAQQQQAPEPPPSTDATLSGLTLSDVTLAFASATTRYSVSVANDVTETTVTPTTNDDGATHAIKLGGVTDADGVIPLAVGSNVITVEVTAEDGNTAKTYTVTVTRAAPPPSADATLSSLTLSDAAFTFASDTTSYDVSVANGVDETTVRATANDDGATYEIKLGGVVDADGTVSLAVGGNVITVEVTAEDGKTTKTYTVTVTRAAPDATAPDAPDRPTGQSTGEGAVSLDWNDVPSATSYAVRVWQVDAWTELSADASVNGISITFNGSSATVSGLSTDYEWYYFQVSAVNDAGASGWSPNNAIEVLKDEQLTAPNQPEGQWTGPGAVSLDWNDVPSATSYAVRVWQVDAWTELSADASVKGISITFNGSSATVSGLPTDYEWYYFQVSATNDAGASDWSDYNAIEVP